MRHLDKICFVICLAFYAWGIIDDRAKLWGMIGGNSTFILYILVLRKRKGQRLVDLSVMVLIICVVLLLGLQILDYIRDLQKI
jgi:hypothetical protein